MDDFSKLDFEELVRFRELQGKMRRETGSIEGYSALTVEELKFLERCYYKMKGEPYPWDETPTAHCHWCGHVLGVVTYTNSSVPGVCCSEQCLENSQLARQRRGSGVAAASASAPAEPVAIAQAPASMNPAAPATPAQPEKPRIPSDTVVSAAHQLDAIMRFGYDLLEEPR